MNICCVVIPFFTAKIEPSEQVMELWRTAEVC